MYLIIGIDPGKTCGIVCLDLNGKLLFKEHKMFGGMEWLISTVNNVGTPVVVASDKPAPSALVKRINAAFNARLYSPEREFRIDVKRSVAKNLGIKDPHERDAYIAASSVYNFFSNKFKQVEHIANGKDYKNIDEIKAKVVGKYSINEAIENKKANRR